MSKLQQLYEGKAKRVYATENADEVIVGSASAMFRRVSEIDGRAVGGKAEKLFNTLAEAYKDKYENE